MIGNLASMASKISIERDWVSLIVLLLYIKLRYDLLMIYFKGNRHSKK